jgi:8-oxo-dGTP pyrophosphatase MutT (NUDIX family)
MPEAITAGPSLDDVRRALSCPLPGMSAQIKMAPQPRPGWDPSFILLYPRVGQLHLVLTRRTQTVRSHKGQISLPGGARENNEPLIQTALRETLEELGIPSDGTEVIGPLSVLYTPPSRYCIYPFVAHRLVIPTFHPDPVEVAEVLEVPLATLLDPSTRRVTYWSDPDFETPRRVPFFNIHDQVVWGATAMILSELVTMLEDAGGGSLPQLC